MAQTCPPELSATTLDSVFELLRPRVSPALLSGDGWMRMQACARELPAAAIQSGIAFEVRLEVPDPSADLGILTRSGCAVSSHFISRGKASNADAVTAGLGKLLVEREKSPISNAVGGVTLEFDVARHAPGEHKTGIFISAPEFHKDPSDGYADPGQLFAALSLAGCPERSSNRKAIESVFAEMPPQARVSHCGMFPFRDPPILRLNISGIEISGLRAFLDRFGWPGKASPVIEVLREFRDLVSEVRLALDIHDGGIAPRLGLEMQQPATQHGFDNGSAGYWCRFMDRLEERRMCLAEKAAGLRTWPGWELIFGRTTTFALYRTFHHFKFDMKDGEITARAYIFALLSPAPGISSPHDAGSAEKWDSPAL